MSARKYNQIPKLLVSACLLITRKSYLNQSSIWKSLRIYSCGGKSLSESLHNRVAHQLSTILPKTWAQLDAISRRIASSIRIAFGWSLHRQNEIVRNLKKKSTEVNGISVFIPTISFFRDFAETFRYLLKTLLSSFFEQNYGESLRHLVSYSSRACSCLCIPVSLSRSQTMQNFLLALICEKVLKNVRKCEEFYSTPRHALQRLFSAMRCEWEPP